MSRSAFLFLIGLFAFGAAGVIQFADTAVFIRDAGPIEGMLLKIQYVLPLCVVGLLAFALAALNRPKRPTGGQRSDLGMS